MMDFGRKEKHRAMEFIRTRQDICMKVYGSKTIKKDRVWSHGLMELLLEAFLSKERRFKEVIKSSDNPGPGFYQNHDPLLLVKNSIKTKKKKQPKFPEKAKLSLMRYEKSPGSPNRVITIPSKNLSYGYDIKPNGEILMKEDPEKSIKFKNTFNNKLKIHICYDT